jgi:hypothetical protein
VVLTGHELTVIPSAVAMLAIIGGYIGVRSANRNALAIAREERSSRRRDEFDALKRATYARFLTALASVASAALEQEATMADPQLRGERIAVITKKREALAEARNIAAELDLLATDALRDLANNSLETARSCRRENAAVFTQEAARLRAAMRFDLHGAEIPNLAKVDRLTHDAIAALPPAGEADKAPAAPSVTGGRGTAAPPGA